LFTDRSLHPGPPDDDDSAPLSPVRRMGKKLLEQLPDVISRNLGIRKFRTYEIEEVAAGMLADLWYRRGNASYLDNPAGQTHLARLAIKKYAHERKRSSVRRLERQAEYAFALDMVTNLGQDPEHDLRYRELLRVIYAALAIMPQAHADAFVAHTFAEMSRAEAATLLGMSVGVYAARRDEAQAGVRIALRDQRAGRPARPWPELKKLITKEIKGELA
jgi:DNA-directed RNA polymerase specialized sigma24 family protein